MSDVSLKNGTTNISINDLILPMDMLSDINIPQMNPNACYHTLLEKQWEILKGNISS